MSEAAITETVIEMITAAGMDYHRFKCEYAAKNYNQAVRLGHDANLWVSIAEMSYRLSEQDWQRVWELAGVSIFEEYLEAA